MECYNSYNKGTITASRKSSTGAADIGGITGRLRLEAKVGYSYNLGDINNTADGQNTGGIVGYNIIAGTEEKYKIQYSYNSGNVTSKGYSVGGICGRQDRDRGTKDSYTSNTSTVKYNTSVATSNYGSASAFYGKIIGQQLGLLSNVGILEEMPSVYYVVNSLNEGKSEYWSKENVNEPKLLWEK